MAGREFDSRESAFFKRWEPLRNERKPPYPNFNSFNKSIFSRQEFGHRKVLHKRASLRHLKRDWMDQILFYSFPLLYSVDFPPVA